MSVRSPVVIGLACFVGLLALLDAQPAAACAGCRNPNLPITRLSTAQLAPGQIRASALVSATTLNVVHEAGCADAATCDERPVQPPFLHDQDIYPGELRVVAEVGISASWGAEVQLPLRITSTRIRYTDLAGAPYQPADPGVHHRNETLAGLGDPWLLARWGDLFGRTAVTGRAGVTLPLGRTEADPFALGAVGLRHQHIQFGNGTFNPLLMLDVSHNFGRTDVSAYAQTELGLADNEHGFRPGHRYFTGLQAGRLIWPRLTLALGLDVIGERPERWGGKIQQDGNLGRTELLGGVSVTRSFGTTVASAIVRFPIVRHIVAGDEPQGRLSSPLMVSLIVSRTFARFLP